MLPLTPLQKVLSVSVDTEPKRDSLGDFELSLPFSLVLNQITDRISERSEALSDLTIQQGPEGSPDDVEMQAEAETDALFKEAKINKYPSKTDLFGALDLGAMDTGRRQPKNERFGTREGFSGLTAVIKDSASTTAEWEKSLEHRYSHEDKPLKAPPSADSNVQTVSAKLAIKSRSWLRRPTALGSFAKNEAEESIAEVTSDEPATDARNIRKVDQFDGGKSQLSDRLVGATDGHSLESSLRKKTGSPSDRVTSQTIIPSQITKNNDTFSASDFEPIDLSPDNGSIPPTHDALENQPLQTGSPELRTGYGHIDQLGPTQIRPAQVEALSVSSIGSQLKVAISQSEGNSVDIALSPAELGKVRMTLQVHEQSVILVVAVERGETAEMMRRHIDTLTHDFKSMGFSGVSISVSDDGPRGSRQGQNSSTSRSPETAAELQADILEAETLRGRASMLDGLDLKL